MTLLEIDGVSKTYNPDDPTGGVEAVRDVDLGIDRGDILQGRPLATMLVPVRWIDVVEVHIVLFTPIPDRAYRR